jgi:hypothetical protein
VFTPGWLFTGPVLVGILLLGTLVDWSTTSRPAPEARGLLLLIAIALAGCVRRRWPFPAVIVMSAAAVLARALDLNLGALVALLAFAIVTVVRRAPWPQAVAGTAVAGATLAILMVDYSVVVPTAEMIGWAAAVVAGSAALGGALRLGRHLRARRRLARDRDTLTVVPVARWGDG